MRETKITFSLSMNENKIILSNLIFIWNYFQNSISCFHKVSFENRPSHISHSTFRVTIPFLSLFTGFTFPVIFSNNPLPLLRMYDRILAFCLEFFSLMYIFINSSLLCRKMCFANWLWNFLQYMQNGLMGSSLFASSDSKILFIT